jgi:exosortase/archaeosortase family protein
VHERGIGLANSNVNSRIQFTDTVIKLLQRLGSSAGLQWQLLAGLQALLSIWLIQATQDDQGITLLAVVVWGGAAICMEDQLEDFRVRPSWPSLVAGLTLLAYATWRSVMVLDLDSMSYVLPVIQGLGLGLMARPVRQLLIFREPFIILSLFPLQFLAFKLLPEYWLSVTTGKIGQIFMLLFGVESTAVGRIFRIGGSGVSIQPACSGAGLIAQQAVVAVVFIMAYPIRSTKSKLIFLVIAPLIGYLVNACRIILLAVIVGSSLPQKQQLFDFMHDEWGGLVFSGIATIILGQIYMSMVNRQLADGRG